MAGLVDRLDRHRLLVWVDTHDHTAHIIDLLARAVRRRGRAGLLRAGQSPLEPRLTTAPGGTACQMRATPPAGVGSRCNESAPPSTSTTAWPGCSRKRSQQVAAIRAPTLVADHLADECRAQSDHPYRRREPATHPLERSASL